MSHKNCVTPVFAYLMVPNLLQGTIQGAQADLWQYTLVKSQTPPFPDSTPKSSGIFHGRVCNGMKNSRTDRNPLFSLLLLLLPLLYHSYPHCFLLWLTFLTPGLKAGPFSSYASFFFTACTAPAIAVLFFLALSLMLPLYSMFQLIEDLYFHHSKPRFMNNWMAGRKLGAHSEETFSCFLLLLPINPPLLFHHPHLSPFCSSATSSASSILLYIAVPTSYHLSFFFITTIYLLLTFPLPSLSPFVNLTYPATYFWNVYGVARQLISWQLYYCDVLMQESLYIRSCDFNSTHF